MEPRIKYSTFEAFKYNFDALAIVGYFKILSKSVSPINYALHVVYRYIVWVLVITNNLQHFVRLIEVRHSTAQIVDILFILLTILNTLCKQLTLNVKSRRVDHIIGVINGPVFESRNTYHVAVMKENARVMRRLLLFYLCNVTACCTMWGIFPLVNRAAGMKVEFTGYIPFDTSSSLSFGLALAYMTFLITFQAYGTVILDCTIVSLYAQVKVQLQMLRYNLEHLADVKSEDLLNEKHLKCTSTMFKDVEDMEFCKIVQRRLVRCVLHHQKILWFNKEVEAIFAEAMLFQFFSTAWIVCMTCYKLVGLSLFSAEFFSLAMYGTVMLAQLYIFCYFGTQVKYESDFVNQSAYCGAWLSLSPGFRRQLLLMMVNCTEPIKPRTAYVVPISLETYISVLRASYTLFTFLERSRSETKSDMDSITA